MQLVTLIHNQAVALGQALVFSEAILLSLAVFLNKSFFLDESLYLKKSLSYGESLRLRQMFECSQTVPVLMIACIQTSLDSTVVPYHSAFQPVVSTWAAAVQLVFVQQAFTQASI